MATPWQIAANRSNARNSTGPTSDEGKDHSRSNAVKHGLAGSGVVVVDDDQAVVAQRLDSWRSAYPIHSEEDQWFFEQIVVNSVRIDRCQREEATLRTQLSERATRCWNLDRGIAVEALGKTLSKTPSLVACKLHQTLQGCDWLLDRWNLLKEVLDVAGAWTEEHESLALDMLGTPLELRTLKPWSGSPWPVVVEEIEALRRERDTLAELDALDHRAAVLGMAADLPRPLALQRRYEAGCMRRLQWARNCLGGKHGDSAPPEPRPLPLPIPQPEPEPEFVPEPPARDPDPEPEPEKPPVIAPEVMATVYSAALPPARWTRLAVDGAPTTSANRKSRRAARKLVACRRSS